MPAYAGMTNYDTVSSRGGILEPLGIPLPLREGVGGRGIKKEIPILSS